MKNKDLKFLTQYFSKGELILWFVSALLIVISFLMFDRENYLTLTASLIGVTSLIFNAKGNPFGQLLMVVFSILYGIISFSFNYYGEMVTYLGMTAPMAIFSFISWMRNPYSNSKAEVKVSRLNYKEIISMILLTIVVTIVFYFILSYFNTANIILSTLSVATSFLAVYLSFKRSAYYAVAYALNDIVLIALWLLASATDMSYFSVTICFVMFLVNDIYGFINWLKMRERQETNGE